MFETKSIKYRDATASEISSDRVRLGNNYAHIDDDGYGALVYEAREHKLASISEITNSRLLLQDPYAHLDEDDSSGFSAFSLKENDNKKASYSFEEIEQKAINLQRLMWTNKHKIWPNIKSHKPTDVLDPYVAFRLIGYDFDKAQNLGQYKNNGKLVDVAGVIDNTEKKVRISRLPKPTIQLFTAAHELGHALLHDGSGLHRDMPLDGSESKSPDRKELEANKFATFFLMPQKQVNLNFKLRFLTESFTLNEATAHALGLGDFHEIKDKFKDKDELSKVLAGATHFNGKHFDSLATQFKVSIKAMAIRLKELNLV